MRLRIGARGSKLATTQTQWVGERLRRLNPAMDITYEWITTTGDRDANSALQGIGGKGVFVKEIEEALLDERIDLAVHSLKDVPQSLPDGLILGPFPEREDPRDALVSRFGEQLNELPRGSTIGTSSPRRRAQILARYRKRDYRIETIRGNVDTRLQKVKDGKYDAVVFAYAGLKRLGLEGEVSQILETDEMLPAPGQGCLALELRAADAATAEMVVGLRHEESDVSARAERAFLRRIGGNCLVPLGFRFSFEGDTIRLEAAVMDLDGTAVVRASEAAPRSAADAAGAALADRLIANGGGDILKKLDSPLPAPE
jgi:hydroxymethylbilane synthase